MSMWTCLLLFGVSISMAKVNRSKVDPLIQLDMAPNSVDDMYERCEDKMVNKVKNECLVKEKKINRNFSLAWSEAEKQYNKKWKPKPGKNPRRTLEKEQNMAIYAYTLETPRLYAEFNDAVRAQRDQYQNKFQYHSLHFFLTDALKRLNSRKPKKERCLIGYRRVNRKFNLNILSKEIRFGAFTSSSMGKYPMNEKFGYETCFVIRTCLGADISIYSKFGESEGEVLIPPYEIFTVTRIKQRSEDKNLPCEVVLELKSTEQSLSNLNCAFFPEK
ncbi:NAD(P)(+)--arginine ADP-ribosyltransferase 1-like [Cyprinodon tularosa]|uniref:NAD(P)(+)--arginine ADP-ribosyltransferase 1-like n=1 Tax=Cyprinodon tularosa TaxID=77115 RepID=UPI0018E20D99|nr:NAD(P)(+)--arginine ADP-ribosyltransferase 1-like [Cyprinodon tularosa]